MRTFQFFWIYFKFHFVFNFAPTAANDGMLQNYNWLLASGAYMMMWLIVQLHHFLRT